MSRNPAKSRPLSANVKRMMWLERASPRNNKVMRSGREFTQNDYIFCHKQGNLFMEASAMGISMESFVPLYMESHLAGVIDYCFGSFGDTESGLSSLLKVPTLFENPRMIIETLYWIDDIISKTSETDNRALILTQAYEASIRQTPRALLELPKVDKPDIDEMSYAYWLGYIYRCECILHDESSRMVYGAFDESTMRKAYEGIIKSPLNDTDLSDCAMEICAELDRLLVEKIWPEQNHRTYKGG